MRVLAGVHADQPLPALAGLPCALPEGDYHLTTEGALTDRAQAALGWALVPFTCLVAASRVVLGLHYPTDVLVGAAIGGLLAQLGLALG